MQNFQSIIENPTVQAVLPLLVLAFFLLLGVILRFLVSKYLLAWAKKTRIKWDDVLIENLKRWVPFWTFIMGLYVALDMWGIAVAQTTFMGKLLLTALVLTITVAAANIFSTALSILAEKEDGALAVSSLTKNITRIVIFLMGGLIILRSLGISITPILGTLGVGGLAVALALQETLANIFSGIYVTIAKNIRIGDFIKLETGEEGYVVDIGWRATKVRMLPNNIVIIPNSKLGQSVLTNYYMPETEMAVLVQVGVHYQSDLKHVEKVTIEVGEETLKEVQGGVAGFKPFIRYHTFDDFSINFTVILRCKEFVDNYLIKHEFIKRLHARYNKEGIVIPFPIRDVYIKENKA
ncbi:MAG: mechanosensitive ion channel family protein [Candidatus Kappaea frigidicola]|nr:mechanosensitive ion channel family protein [Candidatus Kappaea frigidicola]